MNPLLPATLFAAAALAGGCMSAPPAQPPAEPPPSLVPAPSRGASANHYRCDNGVEFDLRMAGGTAVLDMGAKGSETLLLDAGGVTPQQSVYTNARVRGEFGLGPSADGVVLHYATAPMVVRCVRA